MKKLTILMMAVIGMLMFVGCTKKEQTCTVTEKDGVKIYKNNNIPTVEKLDFNPVKKFTINDDSNDVNHISRFDIDLVGVDSEDNIYIADYGTPKVNKYDKNGKFVNSFVKQGSGPGEVDKIIYVCVKNDTVYIGDAGTQSVSLFNTYGEFLCKIKPEGFRYQVRPVGTDKFLCALFSLEITDGRTSMTKDLTLLNNSFEPLKALNHMKFYNDEICVPDEWDYVSVTKDRIYVGVNDKMFYKINVFDHNGNLLEVVSKNFAAISFSEKEYSRMTSYLKKAGEPSLKRHLINKKRAVVGVYNDKYGNLIVHPAVDTTKGNTEGMLLDFYSNGNNEYMNSYVLKTDQSYYQCDFNNFLKFDGDKMLKIDSDKSIIDVYEY